VSRVREWSSLRRNRNARHSHNSSSRRSGKQREHASPMNFCVRDTGERFSPL
jgi:hypothetical protein